MDRYIIIIPHTLEECRNALKQIESIGTITHFDWGCKDGEHTGWAVIEADNRGEAMLTVPTIQRSKAHVFKLTRFSPEDVRAMHV